MTTENTDPGQGYRLLKVGEATCDTDEYYADKRWLACMCFGSEVVKSDFPHRRKLTQPDFRWIPVTEKLPPTCLTVCCTNDPCCAFENANTVWSDFVGSVGKWLEHPDRKPTHWCPLPPALKPEPTREDRQVEAFRKTVEHCKPSIVDELTDAFRKALAVI